MNYRMDKLIPLKLSNFKAILMFAEKQDESGRYHSHVIVYVAARHVDKFQETAERSTIPPSSLYPWFSGLW
jgi:hypothetical protein